MPSEDRERMVATQIEARGITDPLVLDAMRVVPRERFVATYLAAFAYDDGPLPIGEGQTISQPYIVAAMAEAVRIKPGERVLEIGTGSGYGAAVLSRIAGEVYTVERIGDWRRRRATGWPRSDMTTSTCARATVAWAGPSTLPTRRSW